MRAPLQKALFETLYRNRYLYRFASTVPFAGQWRIWQRLIISRIQGHDVLELGCGLGDLLADMLEVGYACHAVEHSPEMVAAARDTLRKRHVGSESLVIQGTSQALPFSDASFDTVVSTFPSEYIHDPNTIAEVSRVLRPGGRLIVIEGANLLPVGLLQPLLVLLQIFVYSPRGLREMRKRESIPESEELVTEEVPDAHFGRLIPLERFHLRRRSERVRSRRWEVYLTMGEKEQ
ncbi:class I SAM-dependent methyltransferase [Ktedonospora formicarum]|uniref:Methyltransferase type 11 domain-containing protein n=1 Tax=Ktedonospora formicarum TaxID=2778364 RepID=A0A8J3HV32_9CHLR|nr:class I SAM-dependent methyltransferase [Ktedonospora formicarum]GHO43791.1 hypothetical protein KSX_19540 [Ktedonospora formicarum]